MRNLIAFSMIIFTLLACKKEPDKAKAIDENKKVEFSDKDYVLNSDFPIGDVRRYGIFPDSLYVPIHPFTKEPKLEIVLDLSEQQGIEMLFPQGYYKTALVVEGRKNIKLKFENAEFGGMIQIYEKDSTISQNINLKGTLITYAGFFSRNLTDLKIDSLIIKSNTSKNINALGSKGCKIYAGSKNVTIKNLIIEDFGSGTKDYEYNSAALAIEGWGNNPVNVQVKKVYIKSTDRHGVYITGNDHIIDEIVIDKFGMGTSDGMSPMQDADKGEEKDFKAVWINRCYDSFIERLIINEKESKGLYTAHFDEGDISRPFTIGNFKVVNDNPKIEILKNENTGVIVEIME